MVKDVFWKISLNMRTCWPILYSATVITSDLTYFTVQCVTFICLIKIQRLKWGKSINSWIPLFESDIGEIMSFGCLPQEHCLSLYKTPPQKKRDRERIKTKQKNLVIDLAKHHFAAWNSTLNYLATWKWSESCKTHKRSKQSDPKHIYPQSLCLGNSRHMVCKWCLEILAKSAHNGIN